MKPPKPQDNVSGETPDETLDRAAEELRIIPEAEVLARVRNADPAFLERAVVDLLIAMGYGGDAAAMGRVPGRSGDGGIDGTIREDALGACACRHSRPRPTEGRASREATVRLSQHQRRPGREQPCRAVAIPVRCGRVVRPSSGGAGGKCASQRDGQIDYRPQAH
ncbi:MAG: restriction endonuclease [Alphaproteobacteria bacterium]|nr:restriction endonuclease [Alphaproteobacteria bacterium]